MARSKKPIWKSKIVWAQVISIILEMMIFMQGTNFMDNKTKAGLGIAIGLLTILFRHGTKGEQLTLTPPKS